MVSIRHILKKGFLNIAVLATNQLQMSEVNEGFVVHRGSLTTVNRRRDDLITSNLQFVSFVQSAATHKDLICEDPETLLCRHVFTTVCKYVKSDDHITS